MKVTLLTVVTITAVASLAGAADPECVYRKLRGLAPHWPNPRNCSSYYRCSNKNIAKAINCPTGKEYNPKTGKCSTAGRGLCKLSLAAPLADIQNVCSNEVNGAYLPKAGYCAECYICDNQMAYPQVCDPGSFFDITDNICKPDTGATCWQNQCIGKKNNAIVTSATSCRTYYVCQDDVATVRQCALETYFDAVSGDCVTDVNNEQCWENFCVNIPDGSPVVDPDNCNNFYMCDLQEATLQECPIGSYFSLSAGLCVPGQCPDKEETTTSTTTAAPSTGCDCENIRNGELGVDPQNCRKFYACEDGVLIPGDCSIGNYFNDKINTCVPDVNNDCPASSQPDCVDGDVTENPEICNQYYVCQNGIWQSKTCTDGYYFRADCGECVPDTDNVCPQCENGNGNGNGNSNEDDSNESSTTQPNVPSDECNDSDPIHKGASCYSYEVCMNGQWQEQYCAKDYYFDVVLAICKLADGDQCPENRSSPSGSRNKRSVDAVPEANCTCPGDVPEGSMIPHPTECDKYLICVNSQLEEGSCGVGNIFGCQVNACVPDTEGTCWVCSNKPNGYQMVDPTDCTSYITCKNGVAVPQTCPADEWFTSNGCVIDVTGQCINPCSCGTGKVAHPICSKYYQCTDGVPQVVDCPAGQGFDAASQQCTAKTTCPAAQCATAADGTVYAIPDDNTRFYVCLNNQASIRTCPQNSIFDTTYMICIEQPSCSCDQSRCSSTTLNTVYPSQNNDNSTFCACESGGAFLKNCPEGYFFDTDYNICTFTGPCDPQICVGKPEYSVSVNEEDPNAFCLCRADEVIPVPCPIGYTFKADILLCVLAPQPDPRCCRNYCVGKPNDLTFPAIDNVNGFCFCEDEVPSFMDCPINMTYNTEFNICLKPFEPWNCPDTPCNATECEARPDYEIFPVCSNAAGYCYCKEFCPLYAECLPGSYLDPQLLVCLPKVAEECDPTPCATLPDNQPYEALTGPAGFCYCQNGIPIYKECLEGTQFSTEYNVCLTPEGVTSNFCDSCKCASLAEYQAFPNSNPDDESSFCLCKNGTAYSYDCPEGKVFNEADGVCVRQAVPACVCEEGKCATLPDNSVFAALNSTEGFCLCLEGVATYEPCPAGMQYNSKYNICLSPTKSATLELTCNMVKCQTLPQHSTFAADGTVNGFCICGPDGTTNYRECSEQQIFVEEYGTCVPDACDHMECRSRSKFAAFAAKNSTRGFCACDVVPTYYHCTSGHTFDAILGLCVDEVTAVSAACDPRDCRGRVQYEPFAAKDIIDGFCACDANNQFVNFHRCDTGKIFDRSVGVCMVAEHDIKKRSVEPEEKLFCEQNEKRSLPSNCSQYEICVDGLWRRRSCSEERYYNPEQQRCLEPRDDMVCNYARVPGLPACNARSESKTIANRNGNCMQYFRCAAGRWRLRSCPRRHYYAVQLNTCLAMPTFEGVDFCAWQNRSANNASLGCQHRAVRPSPLGCSTFLMCTENAWWLQHCPLGMYFSRSHNYCQPNDANQCQLETSLNCTDGQKRTTTSSCRSFEQCLDGKWTNGTCGQLEQFDPQLGCVPSDGSCHGNGLRRSCNSGELRGLPQTNSNCTQLFYYCESDEWQLGSCLRGHSFNRELKKCQSLDRCQLLLKEQTSGSCVGQPDGQSVPHSDDCTRFYLCLQELPALPQNCPVGSFFDAVRGYCRPNDGSCQQLDSVCANVTMGTVLIAHAQNCRAYYNCSNNGTQLLYCPKGQYFDRTTSQCRLDQGQCLQPAMSDAKTLPNLCAGLSHGALVPHQLYCNLYQVCVRGLPFAVKCENGTSFNATLGHCLAQQELKCPLGELDDNVTISAAHNCDSLPDGSYVPDYRDCSKYFICVGGVAMSQRCAGATYFDAEQLLCQPSDGICPYAQSEDRHMKPNPLQCEGKHGHMIPDTANCNNFYICISNKLRSDRCYAGHFFNATLGQCQSQQERHELGTERKLKADQKLLEKLQSQSLPNCRDPPTEFSQLCGAVAEGDAIAEPGDCRRYISCDGDEPSSQRCRNGESFDYLLGICRQNDGTCLMENGERVGVCSGKHGQLARDVENCRGYFVCVHGQKIEAECDQGHYFNKVTNTCQLDALQQCSTNSNNNSGNNNINNINSTPTDAAKLKSEEPNN